MVVVWSVNCGKYYGLSLLSGETVQRLGASFVSLYSSLLLSHQRDTTLSLTHTQKAKCNFRHALCHQRLTQSSRFDPKECLLTIRAHSDHTADKQMTRGQAILIPADRTCIFNYSSYCSLTSHLCSKVVRDRDFLLAAKIETNPNMLHRS